MQNLLEKVKYIIIVGAFKRDLLLSWWICVDLKWLIAPRFGV